MVIIDISEEYGYARWIAELTEQEYQDLLHTWETMRGLNCLVPVRLIIPQAKEINDYRELPENALRCHIHECDDSHLAGSNYEIPEDKDFFWINGKKYTHAELIDLNKKLN